LGSLQRSPRLFNWFKGSLLLRGEERRGGEGKGYGRERKRGKGKRGRKVKTPFQQLLHTHLVVLALCSGNQDRITSNSGCL